MSSGATRYGISLSAGGFAQPAAAPAAPMPTSLRKSRLVKTKSLIAFLVVTHDAVHRRGMRGVVQVLAVAAHAPPHLERRILVDHGHLLHRAVAVLAREAGEHVALVVELHVVGKPIDLDPGNLLAAVEIGGELLDLGAIRDRDLVAPHAGADRRQVRDRGLLRAVVAVQAVHAQLAGVDLM